LPLFMVERATGRGGQISSHKDQSTLQDQYFA
jgi:hypothetical protein